MAEKIKVPAMGESITEGTIADWHVSVGQSFASGDTLVEIETDKVTMEVPAPADGVLKEINKQSGDTVEIDEVIGSYEEGAANDGQSDEGSEKADTRETASADSSAVKSDADDSQQQEGDAAIAPAAARMIRENNLNPDHIKGTGKHNQILKADVIHFMENKSTTSQAKSSTPKDASPSQTDGPKNIPARRGSQASGERETVKPMSRLRQRIAERLVSAQKDAAILTTFNEVDMSAVMELRKRYKDSFKEKYGIGLGFMSFFAKAAVEALREIPAVNAEIRDNEIVYKNYYDIGIAVGGPKGLVVPVVRGVDQLTFAGFEAELIRLAEKVKDGSISLDDMQGGTFTISNGGIYGSMMSTPIINPPQSGILGMHNIVKRAVVVNDEIVIRPMMYVALSYDHRIIDGKEAVTFLVRLKECIEDPQRLLLEV